LTSSSNTKTYAGSRRNITITIFDAPHQLIGKEEEEAVEFFRCMLMRGRMLTRTKFLLAACLFALTVLAGCGATSSSGGGSIAVPPTPTGLAAAAGNAQVSLSWMASSGATSYDVQRSTTSGGSYSKIGNPTSPSWMDTNLTNGQQYFYVVSAGNSAGESANTAPVSATPVAPAADLPGPSPGLFANPPYTCVNNYYVATNGNDSNPGTQASPWLTIQNADTAAGGRVAGDCVNVAPGTYAAGIQPIHGGNLAAPTGYVVYRCQTLDGCIITSSGGNAAPTFNVVSTGTGPNYLVLDGFELAASSMTLYGVGAEVYFPDGVDTLGATSHHIWIINNIIHGYGQAGVGTGGGEYFYFLHNLAYDNTNVACSAQGSGLGMVIARAFTGYTPTAADLAWAPFHNVIEYNVAYNNIINQCGTASNPYDTDGNGIIIDTFNNAGSTNVVYPYQTLVANNVSYNNGGKGVHIFRSDYVTVANNTAYDNNLDPFNPGIGRGEIDSAESQNNVIINNIAYPVPATSGSDPRCEGVDYTNTPPYTCPLMTNVAFDGAGTPGNVSNVWSNNISFGGAPPYGWGPDGNIMLVPDTMNCSTGADPNQCNVDPNFVSVAGDNFALQPGSPAIGYGQTQPYLPASAADAGACPSALTTCP
jgi:parallel beta-helix repeat protein